MSTEDDSRIDRVVDVIVWLALSGVGIWSASAMAMGPVKIAIWLVAALCLAVAFGRWLGRRWSRLLAMIVFSCCVILLISASARSGLSLWRGVGIVCGLLGLWHEWQRFRTSAPTTADDEQNPMTSLVLLQRELPYFEARTLAELLSETWGGHYEVREADEPEDASGDEQAGNEDASGCFVVGDGPFVVRCDTGMFIIHRFQGQYWDNVEALLENVPEMRTHRAVSEHQGWVAVDLLQAFSEAPRESFYPQIAKLVAELADDNTLGVLRPETLSFSAWTEELREVLRGPAPLSIFESPSLAPVILVPGDDPRLVAAVEEARRRWPEFVEAFGRRQPGETFVAKVRLEHEGSEEFIWIEVTGIEQAYVHGSLANDPMDLGPLRRGDAVEVPRENVTDWMFPKADSVVGGFTNQVIAAIEGERRSGRTNQRRS